MTTPEAYSEREGTKDYGREYEVQIGLLLFLRSIKKKDTKHTWLAMNVDECGAFDDLLLYRQSQEDKGLTYLIQLKHQTKEQVLRRRDFINARKEDFLLKKYSNSIRLIKTNIDKCDTTKCDILSHLCQHQDSVVFILFTNRGITGGDFLKAVEKNSEKDLKWFLYDVVDTGGCVWQFNYEQLEFELDHDIAPYMDEMFLFTKQIRVKHLNTAIENMIKSFVGALKCDNKFITEIVKDFIWFMTDWSKGHLGGYYPLTKDIVFKVLLDLMLSPYMMKMELGRVTTNGGTAYHIWNKITTDKSLIVVDWENREQICFDFLQRYISNEVVKYSEAVQNKKLWMNNPEIVSKTMLRVISRCKKIRLSEAYEYLWKSNQIPLIVKAETLDEYKDIVTILKAFLRTSRVIIIDKSTKIPNNINTGSLKVLANFSQLAAEEQVEILQLPVTLQKRNSTLNKIITEEMYEHIQVTHIIKILSGCFNIGDPYKNLPENFIERGFTKIWLNCRVLQDVSTDDVLVVQCDSFYDFKAFLKKNNNLRLPSNIYYKKDDSVANNFNNIRIIVFDCNKHLEKIEDNIKHKTFHYLVLHRQDELEWVRSFRSAKTILKYKKDEVDLIEITDVKRISDNLSESKLAKLYLISAQAGMGKTTLMDYISQTAPIDFWVLKVTLLDFVDDYQSVEFQQSDMLEYLTSKILSKSNNKTDLNWAVLQHYADKRQVLILFDGFDEVPVALQERVKNMIEHMRKLQFSIFITTRPVLKSQLEEFFQTFALSLTTFTKDDQFRYLTNYFSNLEDEATSNISDRQNLVNTYVTYLLNAAKKNINDQDQEFTGIPLQTKLLAEVFGEDYKTFLRTKTFVNDQFDFLYLYECFIGKKLKIACAKFGNTSNDMLNLYKTHASLYALRLLFTKEDLQTINVDYLLQHLIKLIPNFLHLIQRDGIVVIEHENVVTFAHRTFAEYLAAEWLYNNFQNEEYSCIIKTLVKKLVNPSFGITRNVFDSFLSKNSLLNLEIIKQNRRNVSKLIKSADLCKIDTGGRNFLHAMAAWGVHHPGGKTTTIPNDPLKHLIRTVSSDILSNLAKQTDLVLCYTPLDYALMSGALQIADEICASLNDFNNCVTCISEVDLSYVYKHCYRNHYGFLGALILKYSTIQDIIDNPVPIEINVQDSTGKTELHWAVITEDVERVKTLLAQGVNPDTKDNKKKTPLLYAISLLKAANRYEIISALLNKKADTRINGYFSHSILHYSVFYNELRILEMLLENGVNINSTDVFQRTSLHWAAIAGKADFVSLLLAKGADINLKDKMSLTAMHCSARGCNVVTTELLIDKIGDINIKNTDGNTPLHEAATNGHYTILDLLITKGANIEAKNHNSYTALHCAILNDHTTIIKLLLDRGADIEAHASNCRTPLFIAVYQGNTEIISLLLDHGANTEAKSSSLKTPLHLASIKNDVEALTLLLSRGANIETTAKNRNTALNFAIKGNNLQAIETLLSFKANIEASPSFRDTPLHFATKKNFVDAVGILLKHGANTEARNFENQTPLHLAAEQNHVRVASLLLANGALVNAKLDGDKSALHIAAAKNYVDLVSQLHRKGANIEDVDEQGMTALHWAVYRNNIEVVELLLSLGADTEARDEVGMTLLHWVVYKRNTNLLKLLISKNPSIDLEVRDHRGLTPLHWATLKGHTDAVQTLLQAGAYVEARDYQNKTSLLWATYNYSPDTINFLLSKGVDLEATDSENRRTALINVTIRGYTNIVQQLLVSNANVHHRDGLGKTALLYSVINRHKAVARLLLEHGGSIEESDSDYERTPLIWAAYTGSVDCVELLLSNGADTNAKDVDGVTALEWAARKAYKRCIDLLCKDEYI